MASKVDPLELRLRNTSNERVRMEGRGRMVRAGRRHCGQEDAGALCAIVAEVAVDKKTGAINVKRLVAAQDMASSSIPTAPRCRWKAA